jgi:hypothetical protein
LLPQQSKIKGQKTLKTHPTIIFKLQEFISWQPMYTFITDTRMAPSERIPQFFNFITKCDI